MLGFSPKELPPSLPEKMGNAFFKGARFTGDNVMWGLPFVALEAGLAQPGEKVPVLTGRLFGLAAQIPIAGALSSATVALIGCPPAAAAVAAALAAAYVSAKLEDPFIRGLKVFTQKALTSRRVAFGGDFKDTVTSQARRQRALRELAGAMPASRQWLGQEALILHR